MTTTPTTETILTPECMWCGKKSLVSVTSEQATKIHAGVAVHEAMPESSPEDREQIISGTHPQCWEDMFG